MKNDLLGYYINSNYIGNSYGKACKVPTRTWPPWWSMV